jgi:preprotein translocase subunit SecG
MNLLQQLAVVFHLLLAFGIIALVLLQRGRGADAGAGFGAGASGTVFGARGSASFLSRTTAVMATLFYLSSLGLAYLLSHGNSPTSVVDTLQTEPQQTTSVPATGAPAAGEPAASVPADAGAPPAPASTPPPAAPPQDNAPSQ